MEKWQRVIAEIDRINAQDPNKEVVQGKEVPKELIYGQRMTATLDKHYPEASELLQIAARGQHIQRWVIPRGDYPMDRKGYLKWRTQLKLMHGNIVGELMEPAGYDQQEIQIVKDLLLKKNLKKDENTQKLEDVICLVFLQYYIDDFAKGKDEEKLIDILQKTWGKMSENAQNIALELSLSEGVSSVIQKALS